MACVRGSDTVRDQLAFFQAHGCGEGQGFYFSPPVVADDFAKLLRTGNSLQSSPDRRASGTSVSKLSNDCKQESTCAV